MKKKISVLSHIDADGKARMVNVTAKKTTVRTAEAHARITMNSAAFSQVMDNTNKKGDVIGTANLAGIFAAKRTDEIIPLCHPLQLSHVKLTFTPDKRSRSIEITAKCELAGKTGVEMEALTAVSVAALTLYDMCKAADKNMEITEIYLLKKSGGRSGMYHRSSIKGRAV